MATDPRRVRRDPEIHAPAYDRTIDRDVDADVDGDIGVKIPRTLNLRSDRVRWSAVIAGLVTALTTLLLLSLLGIAIGLSTVNPPGTVAPGAAPADLGRNLGLWSGFAGLISFLLGGFVAARTAAVFDRGWGALNGTLVFLLGLPVILWLAAQGLGFVLGTFAQGLDLGAGTAQNLANQAGQAAQQIDPVDVARTAERARNAAWTAFLVSLLGLGAGALGGYLGTRRELEVDRTTGQVTE